MKAYVPLLLSAGPCSEIMGIRYYQTSINVKPLQMRRSQ